MLAKIKNSPAPDKKYTLCRQYPWTSGRPPPSCPLNHPWTTHIWHASIHKNEETLLPLLLLAHSLSYPFFYQIFDLREFEVFEGEEPE